ncbi:MAG TPA: phosphoribosylanthranilate isomerase [Bacteroidia bacterium]|nr:phosphoribosylanthranilate isomerase [Bacteroidia bacterium]
MLIKVCGISCDEDLAALSRTGIDFAGFIFVESSPRYIDGKIDPELCALLSRSVPSLRKTGVFMDETEENIRENAERYHLDAVQLHGNETPEECARFSGELIVLKAFPVNGEESFDETASYEGTCDYFLFDAKGENAGGNGISFDWTLLRNYEGSTPFLLGGGIGLGDAEKIYAIDHPMFAGIDINSRFELYPGKKNIASVTSFVNAFKNTGYGISRY